MAELAPETSMRPKERPRLDLTKDDIRAIERMVWAEGRGESPEGRDAIRSVILNRIKSSRFGNDARSVLEESRTKTDEEGSEYTTYQFQPIGAYGSVDNIPAPEEELDQQYFEFLDFIERGEDVSGGRSFFQNTATAEDRYVGIDPIVIGNHTFYRGLEGQEPVSDINFSHNVRILDDTLGFAEGGQVRSMEEQMNLFQEGGLSDDGMRMDPVSGNEVPPGSMSEEVRDDVPAQLSEGEYVVPADVVRYYGVKFFEDLRSEAKEGMGQMEEDGRIGGEPMGAPQGGGLSEEEMMALAQIGQGQAPMQMAAGGLVDFSNDNVLDNIINAVQSDPTIKGKLQQKGVTFAQGGMVQGYATGGDVTEDKIQDYMDLIQSYNTFQPEQWSTVGGSLFPQTGLSSTGISYRTYYGPNGEIMVIPFKGDQPMSPIPEGFSLEKKAEPVRYDTGGGGDSYNYPPGMGPSSSAPRGDNLFAMDANGLLEYASKSGLPFGGMVGDLAQLSRTSAATLVATDMYGKDSDVVATLTKSAEEQTKDLGLAGRLLAPVISSGQARYQDALALNKAEGGRPTPTGGAAGGRTGGGTTGSTTGGTTGGRTGGTSGGDTGGSAPGEGLSSKIGTSGAPAKGHSYSGTSAPSTSGSSISGLSSGDMSELAPETSIKPKPRPDVDYSDMTYLKKGGLVKRPTKKTKNNL